MSFLTLWLVVLILERSIGIKPRNVNLALETVLQFDKPADISVINKVQGFLSQIQALLNKNKINDDVTTRRNKRYKFTDFVEDFIITVKSFDDNDLKEVFRIVDKDLNTRPDNDLIDDNSRTFLSRKLNNIINQPANNIRRDLDKILTEFRAGENRKSNYILDFVNTLYKRNSERKLSKLIKRLSIFRRSKRKSNVVLKNIIEKVFNDVIYEHYNNLEDNERRYIKKFVNSYFKNDEQTAKTLKIKQRAEVTEISHESINTEEKIGESKPTEELTVFELTPNTSKNVPELTTKKILTHITLYPKTIITDKIPMFRTGLTAVDIENIPNEDSSKDTVDKKYDEDTKETNEIFTNHSVEINVNLVLKRSRDSQDRKGSQMLMSFRSKSTPHKVFLRAIKKKSKKSYHKLSTPALSIDTFGSLYKTRTPKKYNNKQIPIFYYNSKTTTSKSTYMDDIVKKTSIREKMPLTEDHRRVNKPINFNEVRINKSEIREVASTRIQHSFTTRSITPLLISTNKVTTAVTTEKSTTKTTQSDDLNEIFVNKNELKEDTKVPLLESRSINLKYVPKENTTQLEIYSTNHINNETTVTEVSSTSFDVNSYIKNSEIQNLDDDKKKKQIEEKMKADFGDLFGSPSTNATTDGFTDIFKDLEDAFQI